MKARFLHVAAVLSAALVFGLVAGGCGQADKKDGQAKTADPVKKDNDRNTESKEEAKADKGHDHSGWWCAEHGIPEAECSMCSPKVAAEFKKKGDWCDKHDRALSQCFICKPERKEYYAAKYRAKYGKEPPPIEESEETKEDAPNKGEKK